MRPRRGIRVDASALREIDKVLLIWKYEEYLDETPEIFADRQCTAMRAVAYAFSKWSVIPRETTRAVLKDYVKDPKKYEGMLKRHEGGRPRYPEGGTCEPGELAAAVDKLIRATSGSG